MKKKTGNNKGFTLIEVLIVMVILGLLAALVGPKLFGHEGKSRQKTAKLQISNFEAAIDTYRLDTGKFPTTDQGLNALRKAPAGMEKKWDGPYLPKSIPLDPWGNPYEYKCPSDHGDYEIISYGADAAPGGEKLDMDIVSWKNIGE